MHLPALAAAIATTLSIAAVADARPMSAGVSLGIAQSEQDVGSYDPSNTMGLFGRIGVTSRVSIQLDLARTEPENANAKVRKITALGVFDVRTRGNLIPIVFAGIGVDEAETTYGDTASAAHIEAGVGLEYRAPGGVTVGADLRVGNRSLDQTSSDQPIIALYAPNGLTEGDYRAARITLGVQF